MHQRIHNNLVSIDTKGGNVETNVLDKIASANETMSDQIKV